MPERRCPPGPEGLGSLPAVRAPGQEAGMSAEELRLGASAFVGVGFQEIGINVGSVMNL